MSSRDQFMSKVDVNGANGCWIWRGGTNRQGYGRASLQGERLAHRISFILHVGPILDGACILHKCDNPPCVNPSHLFLGTRTQNAEDRTQKGRTAGWNAEKTHCKHGHEFSESNTKILPEGRRECRQCRTNIERKHRAKRKQVK